MKSILTTRNVRNVSFNPGDLVRIRDSGSGSGSTASTEGIVRYKQNELYRVRSIKSPRSEQYYTTAQLELIQESRDLTRNRMCDYTSAGWGLRESLQDILLHCYNNFDLVVDKDPIGKGSFGWVFRGIERIQGSPPAQLGDPAVGQRPTQRPFIVKMMRITENDLAIVSYEVDFSYYMANIGLGPEVYDAFFIPYKNGYMQFIVMELFNSSCDRLLGDQRVSNHIKKLVINEMILLLRFQIFWHGLYCSDIVPKNYVVKIGDRAGSAPSIRVRMIDFGAHYCGHDVPFPQLASTISEKLRVELFYMILVIQLYVMIYEKYVHAFKNDYTERGYKNLKESLLRTLLDEIKRYSSKFRLDATYSVIISDYERGPLKQLNFVHYVKFYADNLDITLYDYLKALFPSAI